MRYLSSKYLAITMLGHTQIFSIENISREGELILNQRVRLAVNFLNW